MSSHLSQQSVIPEIKGVVLGKTLGQGAFAFVKVAHLVGKPQNVFAIKFINRKTCTQYNITEDDLYRELMLHSKCSDHPNVILLIQTKNKNDFIMLFLELASSGDLFDKIEPDVGLEEDIGHFYFKQLIGAISFLHLKGIAHRDIKPENILLDGEGNLKLADFGLACVFKTKDGERYLRKSCGSPPYMAPEIIGDKYMANLTDIWSCGVLLYVLLTGETLWEEPSKNDPDFVYYTKNYAEIHHHHPWLKLSTEVVAFLKAVLKVNPQERLSMDKIRKHPWVNKENSFANSKGLCENPGALVRRLMSRLKMDLGDKEFQKATQQATQMSQMITDMKQHAAFSQPTAPVKRVRVDFAASQSDKTELERNMEMRNERKDVDLLRYQMILRDPAVLQYINVEDKEKVYNQELALYKKRKRETEESARDPKRRKMELKLEAVQFFFNSAQRLTRFFLILPIESLLEILLDSMHLMGIPIDYTDEELKRYTEKKFMPILKRKKEEGKDDGITYVTLDIDTFDRSRLSLRGKIVILKVNGINLKKVEFVKARGNPLEWRVLFKRITVLSRDAVYVDLGLA